MSEADAYLAFLDNLFPGDIEPAVALQANPSFETPREVWGLMEEIAGCADIPYNWLVNVAGLVVRGLAGLRCLWYLHGAEGVLVNDVPNPPHHIYPDFDELIWARTRFLEEEALPRGPEARWIKEASIGWNWGTGIIEETIYYTDGTSSARTYRMGKWLRKQGASAELVKEFETREPVEWRWRVSADPIDVLTMSHNRPWKSCMRPGGRYQYGPLTDMAAGSAVLFFYRPGSDKPVGRMILRPAITRSGHKVIAAGGTIYGAGPNEVITDDYLTKQFKKATGTQIRVGFIPLCDLGILGRALTRNISSDMEMEHEATRCSQGAREYEEAYQRLARAGWPEPAVDFLSQTARGRLEGAAPLAKAVDLDELRYSVVQLLQREGLQDPLRILDFLRGFFVPKGDLASEQTYGRIYDAASFLLGHPADLALNNWERQELADHVFEGISEAIQPTKPAYALLFDIPLGLKRGYAAQELYGTEIDLLYHYYSSMDLNAMVEVVRPVGTKRNMRLYLPYVYSMAGVKWKELPKRARPGNKRWKMVTAEGQDVKWVLFVANFWYDLIPKLRQAALKVVKLPRDAELPWD
jgi:hypothetical protein